MCRLWNPLAHSVDSWVTGGHDLPRAIQRASELQPPYPELTLWAGDTYMPSQSQGVASTSFSEDSAAVLGAGENIAMWGFRIMTFS